MYNLKPLGNLNQNLRNLDLTNSVLAQILMFINNSDQYVGIDKKDARFFRNENDKKLVNNLMDVLLDQKILSNKDVYEKSIKVLQDVDLEHPLRQNLEKVFISKDSEISNTEIRWIKLMHKNRVNSKQNSLAFKDLQGFVAIYEKPGGIESGDLSFKLISRPASEKELQKYSNNWENSKYFNVWMRKEASHPKEIYMTKLVNLFYQGKENLYKVRSPRKQSTELDQILVKFIPNVVQYSEFENKIEKLDDKEFNLIREKIDEQSVLRLLIANFLIQNIDVNTGNILVKEQNNRIKLIPIDFSYFSKQFTQDIARFTNAIKEQNFTEAKQILINKYAKNIASFDNEKCRNNEIVQSEIDLRYQLDKISDQQFRQILNEMFIQYDEMKSMLNDYAVKTPKEKYNIEEISEIIEQMKKSIDKLNSQNLDQTYNQKAKNVGTFITLDSVTENINNLNLS